MEFKGRMKRKILLLLLSLQLAGLSVLPFANAAKEVANEGFIIQADRVIGENMKVTIVNSQTSKSSGKPMLRFTYDSAQIYGMKLTKQFNTPNGVVSLTMKANGPVRINGMTVDASNVSFKGGCLYALKVIPDLGLDDVTMVAHYMNAQDSSLSNLKLETVPGDAGVKMPGKLKLLEDLAALPLEQMKKEINRITSGNLPLTCEEAQDKGEDEDTDSPAVSLEDGAEAVEEAVETITEPISDVTEPVKEVVETVTNPVKDVVDTVTDPVQDVVDVVDKVTTPVQDVVDKVTQPVRETVDKAAEPVDKVVKETTKPVLTTVKKVTEPVTKPVVETVDKTVLTTCQELSKANGVITKELGLQMIDEALKTGKTLETLCPSDKTLTERLLKWERGLLDSLGLLSLLGLKKTDPEVNLKKLREAILKEEDGAIIKP